MEIGRISDKRPISVGGKWKIKAEPEQAGICKNKGRPRLGKGYFKPALAKRFLMRGSQETFFLDFFLFSLNVPLLL